MLLKLLLGAPVFLFAARMTQTQSGSGGSATMPTTLPVKMGLWENTLTTSEGETQKTRSCFTKESFERSVTNMPPSCTISNQLWTSHSYSSDVMCGNSSSQSKAHLEMQFLDSVTARSTINVTMFVQGKTIPLTIKTDSHFVRSDCGDIAPGQSREVH
jgi:Protein of unknown function (DUF3617)